MFVVFYGGLRGLYPMDIRGAIAIYLGAINGVTYIIYAADKALSPDESSIRVPEVVLLFLSWVGSPFGALFVICCCRHKVSKPGSLRCSW